MCVFTLSILHAFGKIEINPVENDYADFFFLFGKIEKEIP